MAAFGSQDKGEHAKVCIFCAIASGKVPSKKVYEDSDSIAFLDINPRSPGMTIVAPKKHYEDLGDDPVESLKVFQAAEVLSQMIRQALNPKSVELGIIPSEEVPHFHIRLYPVYGDEKPISESAPMKMEEAQLDEIAEKIKSVKVDLFGPAKVEEEKPAEREWSAEDAKYVRHQIEET